MLEIIRLSEDAISRFRTRGAGGLKKAFKEMLGEAAYLFGTESVDSEVDLKSTTAWEAIQKHLKIVDALASKLLKYKPLIEYAVQSVLLNGPPVP